MTKLDRMQLLAGTASVLLLVTGAHFVRAQTLPATSGSLWFYSPSRYPPSRSVPAAPARVVPTNMHRHVHHAHGEVRC